MSLIVVRSSRAISNLFKINQRRGNFWRAYTSKSNVVTGAKSVVEDFTAAPNPERKSLWRFLKYGLCGGLTVGLAGIGFLTYVSYAYTCEEIDEKTKALREAAYCTGRDHTSKEFEGSLYSAGLTDGGLLYSVPVRVLAKTVEMYLGVRIACEEILQSAIGPTSKLLPDLHPAEEHVFTLVLDLKETLVDYDYNYDKGLRILKRPGLDHFLEHMALCYEIVLYSDELLHTVANVIEEVDENHRIRYKLSRGATKVQDDKCYRDLSWLNRDPAKIIYVSGHAFESCFQPENCIPVKPYKLEADEPNEIDTALLDLIPFLQYVALNPPADIRTVLTSFERKDVANEFFERRREYQRKMDALGQNRFWRK